MLLDKRGYIIVIVFAKKRSIFYPYKSVKMYGATSLVLMANKPRFHFTEGLGVDNKVPKGIEPLMYVGRG